MAISILFLSLRGLRAKGVAGRGNLCPFTCHSEGVLPEWEGRPRGPEGTKGMRRFFATLRMTQGKRLAETD